MAPRNKPSSVLKRDSAFTEAIGKPTVGKPNPFAAVAQGLTAKLEAARPTAASKPVASDAPPAAENAKPANATVESDVTDARSEPAPAPDLPQVGMDAPAAVTAPRAAAPNAKNTGEARMLADVTITMRIETDLMQRAELWAAALGLPVGAIIRKSLNRMKPQLITELKTLKATDVQVNRAESVGYRLQTLVRLEPDELAELEARLDPAGFGVTNSLLNFYTRSRFTAFFDKLMRDAGY